MTEEEPPAIRRRGLTLLGLTLRIAVASAMIAGLSLYAGRAGRAPAPAGVAESFAPSAVPSAAPAAPAALGALAAPAPMPAEPARLGLAESGLDPVRVTSVRLDPATGLRADVLSRGAFGSLETPALRLTLTRGAHAGRAPGLFVLLARGAAEGPALAVVRTGAYGRIATKFGAVETLEATLSGPLQRRCTGFVTRESAVRIDGWLCAPLGRAPEPRALACTLDALSLADPADPASVVAFRRPAARRGPGCEPASASADPAARTGSIGRRAAASKK